MNREDIWVVVVVGSLIMSAAMYIGVELSELEKMRGENQAAAQWAMSPRATARVVEKPKPAPIRVVTESELEDRRERAQLLREQLTESYSTLNESGTTLDPIIGERVVKRRCKCMFGTHDTPYHLIQIAGEPAELMRW